MRTRTREAAWFFVFFALPCLGLVIHDMVRSPIPFPQRLCTLEDTCAFYSCLILPGFVYALARGAILLGSASASRSR